MSAFFEHHQQAIRLDYSCFDRILRNAIVQVVPNPASVVGFLKEKRLATPLTPAYAARAPGFTGSLVCRRRSRLEPTARVRPPERRRKPPKIKKLEKREQNSHFSPNNGLSLPS